MDRAKLLELAAEVRARADRLDAKAESGVSGSSKVTLLFACLELNRVADMIEAAACLKALAASEENHG